MNWLAQMLGMGGGNAMAYSPYRQPMQDFRGMFDPMAEMMKRRMGQMPFDGDMDGPARRPLPVAPADMGGMMPFGFRDEPPFGGGRGLTNLRPQFDQRALMPNPGAMMGNRLFRGPR